MTNLFDEKLVKRAFELISDKYSTESGKKFILHLISSFIPIRSKSSKLTLDASKNYKRLECCITKCNIIPADVAVPSNEGQCYYGYISTSSDKIVSSEALEALSRFIDKRLQMGDDVITKIYRYMSRKSPESTEKSRVSKEKPSKNDYNTDKGPSSKNLKPKNKVFKESKAVSVGIEAIPKPGK